MNEAEAKIYKNYNKEDQEKWEAYLYEQGEVESKEDQRKADEAAWSEDRIACAAVRDAALNAAGEDSRAIDAAWSAYHDSCIVIDDHWDAARAKRESIYRAGIDKGRQQIIKGAEMKFDNHWLEMGACVPVDMETTAILLDEIQSLRDTLARVTAKKHLIETHKCNTHPNAPHGFLRNASHNAGRYVCECEHWEDQS